MIVGKHEDLRLPRQSPKCAGVQNTVPVPLEAGTELVGFLPTRSLAGSRLASRPRREVLSSRRFATLSSNPTRLDESVGVGVSVGVEDSDGDPVGVASVEADPVGVASAEAEPVGVASAEAEPVGVASAEGDGVLPSAVTVAGSSPVTPVQAACASARAWVLAASAAWAAP